MKNFIYDENYSILKFFYKNPGITVSIFTLIASFTSLVITSCYSMIFRNYYKYWGYSFQTLKVPDNSAVIHFFIFLGISFALLFCLLSFPSLKDRIDYMHLIGDAINSINENAESLTSLVGITDNDSDKEEIKENFYELKKAMQELIVTSFLFQLTIVFFFSFVTILSLLSFDSLFLLKEYGLAMGLSFFISLCSIVKPGLYYFKKNKTTNVKKQSHQNSVDEVIKLVLEHHGSSFPNGILRSLTNKSINALLRNFFFSIITVAGIIVLFCPLVIKADTSFLVTKIDSSEYAVIAQNDDMFYLNKMFSVDDFAFISKSYHRVISTTDISYERKRFRFVVPFTDKDNLKSIFNNYLHPADSMMTNSEDFDADFANSLDGSE